MKKILVLLLSLLLVGILYYGYVMNSNKDSNSDMPIPSPTQQVEEIPMDEVAKHASKDDCYMAIEGKVYDVTPYTKSGWHPGKEAILAGCGKDATELFNKRPGSGSAHSEMARKTLAKYEIGILTK